MQKVRKKALDILRCQQCLGKLSCGQNELVCMKCNLRFPIHQGLIFMGFDENKTREINKIIFEERKHQTNLDEIQKHYDFAYPSFKIGLSSIRVLKYDIGKKNMIAVDLGSGGAPMSKMLSENGFDTFRCELDPNSLYSGFIWKHNKLYTGKHIVCDATFLPFENCSIDAVFCKEFIHHVKDYKSLFIEINRVLKNGGIFLMIEPTHNLIYISDFLKKQGSHKFGHYYQSTFNYYSTVKKNGFFPYRYYLYFYDRSRRLNFLNLMKDFLNNQIDLKSKTTKLDLLFRMCINMLIGGSIVIYSRKIRNINTYKKRPNIQVVELSQLKLNENYLTDDRLNKFYEIFNKIRNEFIES